jgi:glycerophosphoryl diester phosphodiesterase
VADRTAAELQTLDAGRWFDARFADTRLPLLAEALDAITPHAPTLVERKHGDARTGVEFLRRRGEINRVVVQSFDWDYLRDFHALAPEQVLGALGPVARADGTPLTEEEKALSPVQLERLAAAGASVAVWSYHHITADSVREAHARGLKVWVYTVNDLATAQQVLALGIDGVITNHPPLLWKALALRSERGEAK